MTMSHYTPISYSHVEEVTDKTQIVISSTGSQLDSQDWLREPYRPYTLPHYVVGRKGDCYNVFGTKYYSHYLERGDADKPVLNIVLDNCGALHRGGDGKFYPVMIDEHEMPIADTAKRAVRYFYEFCSRAPHKGHTHYELIYPAQIDALRDILDYHLHYRRIAYHYDLLTGSGRSSFCRGVPGVYLACDISGCCRDIHPQIELINLLKSLSL